jgi:hypothetical protein
MIKKKSHKYYVELRILYFIWVLGALYYQGGYIRWVGEVQNIKNLSYHQKLLSSQTCLASQPYPRLTKHIRILGQILKVKDRRRRPEGGWMRGNQNFLQELDLYLEIDPTPLSSNSVKTAQL